MGDAGELAGLRWTWRTTEHDESGMERSVFDAAFGEWMHEHRESHTPFVADEGGASVGMAWLATLERVPGPGVWRRLGGAVQSVYVLPEHRGHGLGSALVQAVVSEARSNGLGYLIVHPSERAFPLYRRLGFGESGRVLELRF